MSESSAPAGAATATFGALGNFLIMLFIGLYAALDPQSYRKGLLALLAPSLQSGGEDILTKASDTLANWQVAQLMAMAVVGILTWIGLWLVDVPLAPILPLSRRCWPSFAVSGRSLAPCRLFC